VFAKSCTRPSGNTDSNEGQEKASNFGTLAMLAPATVTSPGANGLRPLGLISGSAMRLAKGWAMAARIGASVMSTAASTVLLALWPSKLGDSTLYTEEELLEMAEAAIRVRFHLHVDATGNLRVAGYHVNDSTGYKDRVPVAHAELKGENFEVVVDDDFTLVWYPDDSGHRPVVSTEYPADSGIDPYSILVTPIQEDGQEHSPPGYQRPFEDQVELIVSFPKDSGIEPLYLVFQKSVGGDGESAPNNKSTLIKSESGGTLVFHENLDGHTIRRHVGKTEEQLLQRFETEPDILGSSTYTDLEIAQRAIGDVLSRNSNSVQDWLINSPQPRLALNETLDYEVGQVIPQGDTISQASNKSFVLLVKDPLAPNGYRVHTSFPKPNN
jgi:hypothetical protein